MKFILSGAVLLILLITPVAALLYGKQRGVSEGRLEQELILLDVQKRDMEQYLLMTDFDELKQHLQKTIDHCSARIADIEKYRGSEDQIHLVQK